MRKALLLASFIGVLAGQPALAQDAVKLKFSHWVIAGHPVSRWIQAWADDMKVKSGGKLDVEVFPNQQLGPAADHIDMVRRGTVDMAWILHGYTSDRFPLTTLFDIPFVVDDAVVASKVANNKMLREKYFDREARGVKILVNFTNQPTHLFTTDKPVHSPADLKGQRIRFPSATAKRFVEELGATPVGLPGPAMAENLQKGVIDGTITDYGAAGITFKLGGLIKHSTELRAYVVTFALIINPNAYARLKGPVKELFDKSFENKEAELGGLMDSLDAPGKKIVVEAGLTPYVPNAQEMAEFRAVGKKVADAVLAEREKPGVPAREAFAAIQKVVAETKK